MPSVFLQTKLLPNGDGYNPISNDFRNHTEWQADDALQRLLLIGSPISNTH